MPSANGREEGSDVTDFKNHEEKLVAIQGIGSELFGYTGYAFIVDRLLNIDSICDVPIWEG